MITASEIRQRFLAYYEKNGHKVIKSSSLVPNDDPSLLFTNAGMVQFKKIFLGQEQRPVPCATTSQKCLRVGGKHNDLENVGRTARHHTFFEMLGNFSFGDYFKEEAIRFAWTFITEDLKLDKSRLYVTIYKDDDEAFELWQKVAGIAPERIFRLGEKDNFWSMGDTGPCGPCSEIHYDQGEDMKCGDNCGIGKCDCDRFLEIWNLVFMQYNQAADGTRTRLPNPCIDTGMGLERISAICQGVRSNFDCDLFQAIIGFIAKMANVKYREQSDDIDTALRVMADHSRAMAFMVADGILPSNEGRGYVLRRLIRRAYRFGHLIGLKGSFLYKSALNVVDEMGEAFPELRENKDFMARVVREEEERFNKTLDKGLGMLEDEFAAVEAAKGEKIIAGDVAFKLYDTYGFPIDIVNDIAEKRGFAVDEAGFTALMKEQKTRAKAAWKGSCNQTLAARFQALLEEGISSEFIGYDTQCAESRIIALMDENTQFVEELPAGSKGYLVSTRTPFYGESGGQQGDNGTLQSETGKANVTNSIKPSPRLIVQVIDVTEGKLLADQAVQLCVDSEIRLAAARNHSTTHMLHAALRRVLGDHVKQAGSLVCCDRLRFDFTHISAMTPEELLAVEREVNRMILANIPLETKVMAHDDAINSGATALFGEKYGDEVRVVSIPGESVELCGGTHLSSTGQAGSFYILSESGVAAGVRRIEAATGWNALNLCLAQRRELHEVGGMLKAQAGDVAPRVQALQQEVRALKKELEKAVAQAASGTGRDLMAGVEDINGMKVLAAVIPAAPMKALRDLMDDVRSKMDSGIACLVSATDDGKVSLIVAVSKDLHSRVTAPALIKEVATLVGGSGGGRPDMAQAGGTDAKGMDAALAKLKELVAAL